MPGNSLNAKDATTADGKRGALREKLARIETILDAGPYFAGGTFSMVDAVFAPIFRYFDVLRPEVSAPIFGGLNRVTDWRRALRERASVVVAVSDDYGARFRDHLRRQDALLAV